MAKNILLKGTWEHTCEEKLRQFEDALGELEALLEPNDDPDCKFDEVKDSKVALILGYDYVNKNKHGFDCAKNPNDSNVEYLEVKKVSLSARKWNATFNDTSEEKALSFAEPNVSIAVPVFSGMTKILFIVYGSNANIGYDLRNKVLSRKVNSRSTQSIPVTKLLSKYGFKIKMVDSSRDSIERLFSERYPRFVLKEDYFE